jgi:hypothetical protein
MNGEMMIDKDYDVLWRPQRVFIPQSEFTGWLGAAGVRAGTGTGAPIEAEISTFATVGCLMDTAGDELNHYMALPSDIDIKKPIYVRVHWTSGSADVADTVTWLVRYKLIVPNVTVLADPATALDVQPVAQDVPVAVAYTHCATSWGALNPSITEISEKAEFILWEVEMDAFDAGLAEAKLFLGLELEYTPKRLKGNEGMRQEAKRPTYLFSKNYPN